VERLVHQSLHTTNVNRLVSLNTAIFMWQKHIPAAACRLFPVIPILQRIEPLGMAGCRFATGRRWTRSWRGLTTVRAV
jgi:hypothetical protein